MIQVLSFNEQFQAIFSIVWKSQYWNDVVYGLLSLKLMGCAEENLVVFLQNFAIADVNSGKIKSFEPIELDDIGQQKFQNICTKLSYLTVDELIQFDETDFWSKESFLTDYEVTISSLKRHLSDLLVLLRDLGCETWMDCDYDIPEGDYL